MDEGDCIWPDCLVYPADGALRRVCEHACPLEEDRRQAQAARRRLEDEQWERRIRRGGW